MALPMPFSKETIRYQVTRLSRGFKSSNTSWVCELQPFILIRYKEFSNAVFPSNFSSPGSSSSLNGSCTNHRIHSLLLQPEAALILVLGKFAIDSLINSYLEPTTSSEVPVAETFSAPIEIEISDSENLIEEVEEVAQEVIEEVEEATQEVIEEVVEQRAQEAVEKNPYITDEMLVSKKGTPLKGSSRTARINKLLSQGYILQP
jgi:hypothetical protein